MRTQATQGTYALFVHQMGAREGDIVRSGLSRREAEELADRYDGPTCVASAVPDCAAERGCEGEDA